MHQESNQPVTPINPETVTTIQLLSSFTARHWFATFATIAGLLGSTIYGGFWAGEKLTESKVQSSVAQQLADIAALKIKLETAENESKQVATANLKLQDYAKGLQQKIDEKNAEVVQLVAQLGSANNCKFIHDQITSTVREINNLSYRYLGVLDNDFVNNQKAILEMRLAGYQKQLSTCNNKS